MVVKAGNPLAVPYYESKFTNLTQRLPTDVSECMKLPKISVAHESYKKRQYTSVGTNQKPSEPFRMYAQRNLLPISNPHKPKPFESNVVLGDKDHPYKRVYLTNHKLYYEKPNFD